MSHLDSQTFKTLIQIFSYCRQFNQPPKLVSFSLPHPDSFSQDDAEKTTRDKECGNGKLIGPVNVDSGEKLVEERRMVEESSPVIGLQEPDETGTTIDEIAHLMSVDDDVNILSWRENLIRRAMEEDNRPNTGVETMMIDELERIINDNTATTHETNAIQEVRLDCHNCEIAAQRNDSTDLEGNPNHKGLDVSEFEKEVQHDSGCCFQKDSETVDLPMKMDAVDDPSRPSESEETHMQKSDALETENGTRCEIGNRENLVDSCTALNFPQTNIENGETEEGEISGGHAVDGISIEKSLANIQKIDIEPVQGEVSKDVKEKNKVKYTEKNWVVEEEHCSSHLPVGMGENSSHGGDVVIKKGDRDKKIRKLRSSFKGKSIYSKEEKADIPNHPVKNGIFQKQGMTDKEAALATRSTNTIFYGDIWNENSSKEVTAAEKQESGVTKRKRKQRSEESKMRKKKKERIKRAKKNRELGVKRLKLLPVEKPKPVVYCRHYLQGRCHEGEKCKFSHDTVPLTKSKPCVHFARQSCMKGDECPFDHDLSKYPCHSYTSTGSCPRGKDCLFSHKMVSNEDTVVVPASTDIQVRTLLHSGGLSSMKKPDILASQRNSMLFDTAGMSSKNVELKETSSFTEFQSRTPERSAIGNAGKLLLSSSMRSKVDGSPSKNKDIQDADQKVVAGSSSRQSPKTPSSAPRGINFLSFVKTSLGALAFTAKSDGSRSTLEKSLLEQDGAVVAGIDKSAGNKANQSFLEVASHSISSEVPIATLPVEQQKSESRPFGSSSNDASSNKQAYPPPICNIMDSLVQGEQNATSKTQSLSFTRQVPPPSPPSGQSSGHLVFGHYKNISTSAQKAISSTLAFAARCEREMKKNQSTGNFASDTRENKGSNVAGPSSDSAKALKILDFLSGIGKKKS